MHEIAWGLRFFGHLAHVEPLGCVMLFLLQSSPVRSCAGLQFESSFRITLARRNLGTAGFMAIQLWRVKCKKTSYHRSPVAPKEGMPTFPTTNKKETRYQIKNTRNQPTKNRRRLRQKSLGKVWGTLSSSTDKDVLQQFHRMPQATATEQSKCNNVSLWLPAFCTVKAPNHAASKDRRDTSSAASIKRPPRPCPRNAVSTWKMKWLSEKSVSQWENGLPCAM